jgi:hypothetical protein
MCKDNRIYPGRPVLVSGDCKRETGEEHAQLIQTVIDGVDSLKDTTELRIVSLASDGETRRGSSFILLTFKHRLLPQSPIFRLLQPLTFLNLHVGDDDLTCDKDWKHIFKRFRNLLLRQRGVVIKAFRITPDIIRDHFKSNRLSADHIRALFNPDDQQDMKLAFDMLKDIWSLPRTTTELNSRPGALAAREALWILGKLLFHLVFPYLCVDLSLSEQIEHLSAAAHLALALYKLAGKDFIPTNLYIDIMIMIKNVLFCVAKAKIDDPDGEFWIILLGTDRLEELFGILRTMVGNDANLDILQLVSRLSGTTEISNILAKYPQWDRAPRRLKLPTLSRDSNEIPKGADHIKPASWRGNVKVKDISLQTSWNRGRRLVEEECEILTNILRELAKNPDVDILAPFGTLLFDVPLADDDIDESLEYPTPSVHADATPNSGLDDAEVRVEVEDALGELSTPPDSSTDLDAPQRRVVESQILINGKLKSKARVLADFAKYGKHSGSTDRLRRVQDIGRHIQNKSVSANMPEFLPPPKDDSEVLLVLDPIATILSSENKLWLCIGEVNALKFDGQPVPYLNLDTLSEETVTVSYQVVGLRPATVDEDPERVHDWRTHHMADEHSFTVPGRLIQPINPTTSNVGTGWYLFQSTVLVTLAASIFQQLTASNLKSVPKLTPSKEYPYREASGELCWLLILI